MYFKDDIFDYVFLNDILIQLSLKCVPNGSINNKPVSVQIMAWNLKVGNNLNQR